MGSPISPIMANIYMENLEMEALLTSPRFWHRNVDDIFAAIRCRSLTNFLDHLNLQKKDIIRFTHEIEQNMSLPFLDIIVIRSAEGSLETRVYRKPTHTDQLLDFRSHHPNSAKTSVISSLVKRNLSVSSSSHDRETETQHLSKVFKSNHYPSSVVRQVSRKCTHQYDLPEREKPIASICIPTSREPQNVSGVSSLGITSVSPFESPTPLDNTFVGQRTSYPLFSDQV